jgi:hypothetical protein
LAATTSEPGPATAGSWRQLCGGRPATTGSRRQPLTRRPPTPGSVRTVAPGIPRGEDASDMTVRLVRALPVDRCATEIDVLRGQDGSRTGKIRYTT